MKPFRVPQLVDGSIESAATLLLGAGVYIGLDGGSDVVAVTCIVVGAGLYVARRVWRDKARGGGGA